MDRIRAMRQRDWLRVFGFGCAALAPCLSLAGYAGADWDALIVALGALMLLRGAVDAPSPSRAEGMLRAVRLVLFMFAFAAVNRAQGGVEGAVSAAIGNWVLWAVAALLVALPLFRKGLPRGRVDMREAALLLGAGLGFCLLFRWLEGAGDMGALRALVATAAVANAAPVWRAKGEPVVAGVAFGLMAVCVMATPGGVLWPVAAGVTPIASLLGWASWRKATPPRA